MTGTRTILATFVLFGSFGTLLRETLFPPFPSFDLVPAPEPIQESEPILASEPISDREEIIVVNLNSANEEESESSREFQRRSLSADQIRRIVIGGLCCRLMLLTISWIYHRCVRGWHGESDRQKKMSQSAMLHDIDNVRTEMRNMLALEKEEKDHYHAEFLKEMDSMRKVMKEEKNISAKFQNEINSKKILMKNQGYSKNAIDAAKRRHGYCAIEVGQIAFNEYKILHPASKQFPVRMRAPMKSYPVVSTSTAKKMKDPGGSNRVKQP
jgi:hypothetical protein